MDGLFDEGVYDLRCYKYMEDIVTRKLKSNKKIYKLCKKLLNDIEKSKDDNYPYFFDCNKAEAIDGFISLLRFTEGKKVGQQIQLATFQDFILKNTFCWRLKSDKSITRFNDIIVFIPRKNGKSFICAMLGILACMLEENAEVLNGAGTESQAQILVKQAMRLINSNSKLAKHFKIYKKYIEFKGSTFMPVANNATAMDGKNPNCIMCDEAEIVERALMESLTSGFMQRNSYQCFYISTQYSEEMKTGWLDENMEYAEKVLDGIIDDERVLPIIYQLDDADEVNNPDNWIKANPILEVIDAQFLHDQYKKCLENPFMMKNFLIKNFNVAQSVADENSYLDMDLWKKCRVDEYNWSNKEVYVGVDLSVTTDLSCVSIVHKDEYGKVVVASHAFLPEAKLNKNHEKIDYRTYESLGYCTIGDGNIVDYELIYEYIMNLENQYGFRIKGIYFDPYNAVNLMQKIGEDYEVVDVKQSYAVLSSPTKDFREKVYTGQLMYVKNELFDWCVSNAITTMDANGNERLDKKKSKNKIDMIVATIIAYSEAYKLETKPKFNLDAFGYY